MLNERQSRPQRTPLSERVYRQIRRAIIQGKMPPGQKLSEPELAAAYATSRSPVREALGRLEQEGFVTRRASGRVCVSPLDVSNLANIYVVRAALEGLAARLAAERLRPIDLDEMAKHVERMVELISAGEIDEGIAAGSLFHEVIYRECGNPPLVEMIERLKTSIDRYRSIVAAFEDYDQQRIEEHRRILEALSKRNAASAEDEMIAHIDNAAETLLRRLRERQTEQQTNEA